MLLTLELSEAQVTDLKTLQKNTGAPDIGVVVRTLITEAIAGLNEPPSTAAPVAATVAPVASTPAAVASTEPAASEPVTEAAVHATIPETDPGAHG